MWTPPIATTDPQWLDWLYTALQDAFRPRGGHTLDLTHQLADPHLVTASPDHPGRRVTSEIQTLPFVDEQGPASEPGRVGRPDRSPAAVGWDIASHKANLVIADLGTSQADHRLGQLAARALHPRGVLAVLTRCSHTVATAVDHEPPELYVGASHRALIDPTNSVVSSAERAGLTYLQHIVIPTRPLTPPRPGTGNLLSDHGGQAGADVAHIDLHVFVQTSTDSRQHRLAASASPPRGDTVVAGSRGTR